MGKKKKSKKHINNNIERWTEEQYEEYLKGLYGMEFIAGFTESGVPYGLFEGDLENEKTKLWHEGATYIYESFKDEKQNNNIN